MLHPAQILVVEDDPDTRSLLAELLTDAGYACRVTGRGKDGVRLARAHEPDLIILDWMLPDMSGIEVCRALREDAMAFGQILMMTARGATADKIAGLDAGADEYLVKPVNLEELLARVRSMLRIRGLEQRLRREVERSTQRAQELTAVIDHISEGILIIRPDGTVDRANPMAAELLGFVPGRLDDRWLADFRRSARLGSDGPHLTEETCPIARALAGETVAAQDLCFRLPDGQERMLMISADPMFSEDRQVAMVVGVIRDVTHAREVDRLKTQIISHVSHELRTPLAHIKGYASSLLQPDLHLDRESVQEFYEGISAETDRLTRLVSNLLEMSRIDAGQVHQPKRGWCALADLIDHVLVRQRTLNETHHVVVEVPYDLPRIRCDGEQIERVLTNLLDNAAKYTPPGSEIRISVRSTPEAVIVAVADNGPGIPSEHVSRVFDKFYRVQTGANSPPGTGLGLAICKGIVENHGGRMWLESPGSHGKGATFYFALPKG